VANPIEPTARSEVSLREVTSETVRTICDLTTTEEQKRFVAPNAVSIAQAHFSGEAWFRAVYADETPVGFLMIVDAPRRSEYFLWRFMIDARYQRMGFGRRAMGLLVEHVRTRPGATELRTSAVPGEGGPRPFYEQLGFEATGQVYGVEEVLRLRLDPAPEDADGDRDAGDDLPPNLFRDFPPRRDEERIERLAGTGGSARVERIVSRGQASPEGYWYDQDEDEWVALLAGSATLAWEDGRELDLAPGDHVFLPAHEKHRVVRTDPVRETVWLAVFLEG
jgi:diamine N-acetyltransferase